MDNTNSFNTIVNHYRRTGQTTSLINSARLVEGWVIVANDFMVDMLRKEHNYENIVGLGCLEKISETGFMPFPKLFFDMSAIQSLIREAKMEARINDSNKFVLVFKEIGQVTITKKNNVSTGSEEFCKSWFVFKEVEKNKYICVKSIMSSDFNVNKIYSYYDIAYFSGMTSL